LLDRHTQRLVDPGERIARQRCAGRGRVVGDFDLVE
jgi:hypothetical protein